MLKLLILGGASTIAHEATKHFAAEGAAFFLIDRSAERLEIVRNDLLVRGAERVHLLTADLTDRSQHEKLIQDAIAALEGLDAVLLAQGTLSDQTACQQSVELTMKELDINFLSHVSLLTILGNYFEKQRRGHIAVISSVAGDRGRRSNYVYGAAKAGKTAFLQGLRSRLHPAGVKVLTIKPGLVDSAMTADLEKNKLFTDASVVGEAIYKAMKKNKDVVYVPWFWRWIMWMIIHTPEFIFKRVNL